MRKVKTLFACLFKAPEMRRILGCFICFMLITIAQSAAVTTYYVDSSNGNDGNDGLSPKKAWKTVSKVNNSMGYFTPGDSILFKRGCTFKGQGVLYIEAGGSAGNYLTFGACGSGAKPILDEVRCNTSNISYIKVQDLYIKDGSIEVEVEEMEPIKIVLDGNSEGNVCYFGWGENEWEGLPIGSTLDREEGIFSWIPTPGFIGEYSLYFASTDGTYLSQQLRITVNVISKTYDSDKKKKRKKRR